MQALLGLTLASLPVRLLAQYTTATSPPIGCYNYGFAYSTALQNVSGNPFQKSSALECQNLCVNTPACYHFGYYLTGSCYLGGADGILRYAEPGTICGHATCSTNPDACTAVPGPGFPGESSEDSSRAWPGGQQPTPLQCWPRKASGLPDRCVNHTATVLEDTEDGWPGQCEDMVKITDLGEGETCQQRCIMTPLCSIWSLETSTSDTGEAVCWNGMLGTKCFQTSGVQPVRAQRLQHGTYRVLMSTMGMQIMNLVQSFEATLYTDWEEGAKHCQFECRSYLLCTMWQYSKTYGCWLEDPRKKLVGFPLVTGGDTPSVQKTGSAASDIVAGELIQHNCVGPMSAFPTEAPTEGTSHVQYSFADGSTGEQPWWVKALIFIGVVVLIAIVGTAIYLAWEDYERRQSRDGASFGAFGQGRHNDHEQAGLLGGVNLHLPWPHHQQQQQQYHPSTYHGVPGYQGHPEAHRGSHGGRFF